VHALRPESHCDLLLKARVCRVLFNGTYCRRQMVQHQRCLAGGALCERSILPVRPTHPGRPLPRDGPEGLTRLARVN
jgi:hypothetical protein